MKVRMLKDWSWHKSGDLVDVFDPTGRNWILTGIAEDASNPREAPAERAVATEQAESAMIAPKKSQPKKQP